MPRGRKSHKSKTKRGRMRGGRVTKILKGIKGVKKVMSALGVRKSAKKLGDIGTKAALGYAARTAGGM
jgi:hypothetical protein